LRWLVESLNSEPLPAKLAEVLWHGLRTAIAAEALVMAVIAARIAATAPGAAGVFVEEDYDAS